MPIKKLIFDTLLFTCTLGLAAYTVFPISQETYLAGFGVFSSAAIIATGVMLLMATAAHAFKLATVGEILFKTRLPSELKLNRLWSAHVVVLFALALYTSVTVTEASLTQLLDSDGLNGAWRLWTGLTHPNLTLIPKALAQAMQTILIAFLASVLAIPIAFLLAFFAAKNLMQSPWTKPIYALMRLFLNVARSVEPLIWALIFTVWVGVGPFAGMLALMIHSIASLTKYYSEIIENVNEGPIDAIRSTGASATQTVWFAVVPQVLLPYIAMTVYLWDTNVRMATVIGLVGGGGIGTLLIQYQGQGLWPEVGSIILVIAVIVWLLDTASAYIREALK